MANSNYRQIISYHPKFGHLYVPNQHVRMRYGNDAYFLETDELGFRNSNKRPLGKKKLLVLGDSYAAGDGVANEDRFTEILSNKFDIEIVNLAVNGFGMDQQILVYEEFRDQIDHDAVLFAPHMDDLYRNRMSSRTGVSREGKAIEISKPYFSVEDGVLHLNNVPVPKERRESNEVAEEPSTSLPRAFVELKNKAKNLINRTSGKHLIGKLSYPELNRNDSMEWLLGRLLIKKLTNLVQDRPLIICPIPYNYTVATDEPQYYSDIFKSFEKAQIRFVDLTAGLQKSYKVNSDNFFLPLCGHFTPFAHEETASLLEGPLVKSLSLTERPKAPEVPFSGDKYVLGISCFYHDSAATLIKNGEIVAAAQEERFTRKKHDQGFPQNAIHYCLEEGKIHINDLESVCYYDNPGLTLERVLHNTSHLNSDEANKFWSLAGPSMFRKLKLPRLLKKQFSYKGEVWHTEHHISHAASAFYPSPFNSAAILVIDGVGEWACSTIAHGVGSRIEISKQQHYPHSLGLLYSAFTYFCGFKVNSGEYKLMGLAPYGQPRFKEIIKQKVVRIHEDGSIALNLELFDFIKGEAMTNDHFAELFGGKRRESESDITQREMDLAASIQEVTEEVVLKMAAHAKKITGEDNIVLAGGVALNCVANGKLLKENIFKDIWIQPAAGDAGGALGAALDYYYAKIHKGDTINPKSRQTHAYLGPHFSDQEIEAFLATNDLNFKIFSDSEKEYVLSEMITQGKIIGYFDGRMEFGPRALAHRSIIGDPTNVEMQSKFNLKIKYRESFRPFAPIALEENLSDYFDVDRPSPFMLLVAPIKEELRKEVDDLKDSEDMIKMVNQVRSVLPSITHVDYSARLQSMNDTDNNNPSFHKLLINTKEKTGYGVLINTSFNVRGEPIVCTPMDAYRCFMRTEMDVLVLGNYYLIKSDQPKWEEQENWQETFELD